MKAIYRFEYRSSAVTLVEPRGSDNVWHITHSVGQKSSTLRFPDIRAVVEHINQMCENAAATNSQEDYMVWSELWDLARRLYVW